MQQLLSTALAALAAWLGLAQPPHHVPPPPVRTPRYIVVWFDGSGGGRMWSYWLGVGRQAGAHFTFFVSGA